MDDITTKLRGVFAKNRAEELGRDVWRDFVVPPFFDRLDLIEARKPRVIIGGRVLQRCSKRTRRERYATA